jgi:hypothetical protein
VKATYLAWEGWVVDLRLQILHRALLFDPLDARVAPTKRCCLTDGPVPEVPPVVLTASVLKSDLEGTVGVRPVVGVLWSS